MKALELDGNLAEGYSSLGYASFYYDWNWTEAEASFRRAIELNSSYSVAHHWYENFLVAMGWLDEALAQILKARELDPLALIGNSSVGRTYFFKRDYDQAIAELLRAQEIDRRYVVARLWCGWAYQAKGMHDEALVEYEQAARHGGHTPTADAFLAQGHAAAGNMSEARVLLDGLMEQSVRRYVPAFPIALIWIGLGKIDRAFEWLEKALEERSRWMVTLNVDPKLDAVRADPRFPDLVRRIGLP